MSKTAIMAGWDSVPHLSEDAKAELASSYLPHERDARTKGIPQLGRGAIYPVPEEAVICDPFAIPDYYPQCYALDVGWNRTAAVWGGHDPNTDILYLYSEHYRGEAEPPVHAAAIRARGTWIPGVIDPASRGRGQKDGSRLLTDYQQLGLDTLAPAENALEAGIYEVWTRMSTGRLKVFRTLTNWLAEFRFYQRDDKGRVKDGQADHLMDACVAGGTLVQTDRGPIAIRDLVGQSGLVVSRSGAMARFIGARKTIENAETVELSFDDDSVVCCTPDHPFLTERGWVRADCMLNQLCYNGISQRIQAQLWSRLFLRQFRSLTAYAITSVESIFRGMVLGFTERFGNILTAQFQSATMSTIWIKTGPTMRLITSNSRPSKDTSAITSADTSERRVGPLSRPLLNGTAPRLAKSGIANTTSKWDRAYMCAAASLVRNAATSSRRKTLEPIGSVPMLARLGGASILALTTRNAIAWFVAQALWLIATSRNKPARANVVARCLGVRASGRADVYCLTVPGPSSFAIASGLIVHNTRYLVLSGLAIAHIRPASMWKIKGQKNNFESDYDPL